MHAASVGHRDRLPELLVARGLVGTGVEVGVQRGGYSEIILARSRLAQLILVDPWREFGSDYRDIANIPQSEQDSAFAEAQRRLARFGDRAAFWRTTSLEAAARITDASLDFIYLDARHDYEHVMEDLEVWYPKLAPGGVIAGHDYIDIDFSGGVFGVRSAVDEFFAGRRLPVYDTYQDRPWSTWIVAGAVGRPRAIAFLRAALWVGVRVGRRFGYSPTHAPAGPVE